MADLKEGIISALDRTLNPANPDHGYKKKDTAALRKRFSELGGKSHGKEMRSKIDKELERRKKKLEEQYYALEEGDEGRIELADEINKLVIEEYGAGFQGTDELVDNLKAATPGETGKKRKVRPPATEKNRAVSEDAPTNAVGGGAIAGGGYNGPDDVKVSKRAAKKYKRKNGEDRIAMINAALGLLRKQ